MQQVYKKIMHQYVLKQTGAVGIKNCKIWEISGRTGRCNDLEDYSQIIKHIIFSHMLEMYGINHTISYELVDLIHNRQNIVYNIQILNSNDIIKIEFRSKYDGAYINNFPLYSTIKPYTKLLLLFLSAPLNFIHKMRKKIESHNDVNITHFFNLLEIKVNNKLNEPTNIYLILKAMIYDYIIIGDIASIIMKKYISVISWGIY